MSKLKKMLKRAGKAAALAGAGYAASKVLNPTSTGINVDKGRGSSLGNRYRKSYKDAVMRGGKGATKSSISMADKIKNKVTDFAKSAGAATKKVITENVNLGPGPKATSKMGGTLADKVLSRPNTGMDMFGGAKAGKMIKARGGKMVNLKPTKLY